MAEEFCKWVQNSDGWWQTDCKNGFVVNDGTPEENGMKFCCYCGKPLRQKLYEEES